MLPRSQVRELDMTVDEALKYIISMGVVVPRTPVAPPSPPSLAPPATTHADSAHAPVANSRN
jgi:uncharacterized membrane protein